MDSLERPFKPDAILPVSYASVGSKALVSDKAAIPAKIVQGHAALQTAMPIQDNESKV